MNLLLVVLTVGLAVLCLVLFIARWKSRRVVSQLRTEHQALRAENQELSVFRAIRDAEIEPQWIRREAQAQANVILVGAQQAREKTESHIKAQLVRASRESQEALTKATEEASRLRGQANQSLPHSLRRSSGKRAIHQVLRPKHYEQALCTAESDSAGSAVIGVSCRSIRFAWRSEC
jgi:DNA anti-recombination protein RmuC